MTTLHFRTPKTHKIHVHIYRSSIFHMVKNENLKHSNNSFTILEEEKKSEFTETKLFLRRKKILIYFITFLNKMKNVF